MRFALTAALTICIATSARAQDNPFKDGKVGDWAEYKMTTSQMGVTLDSKLKWEISAKDDKEATLKATMVMSDRGKVKSVNSVNNELIMTDKDGKDRTVQVDAVTKLQVGGKEIAFADLKSGTDITVIKEYRGPETKIDLTKPYDPTTAANLPGGAQAKAEKDGDGMEEVMVGQKKLMCSFVKLKLNAMVMGGDFASEMKIWTSKEVPVAGMVKMEMKGQTFEVILELAGSSAGK